MLIEQNWRTERVPNISQHLIERARRRYGLATTDPKVAELRDDLLDYMRYDHSAAGRG